MADKKPNQLTLNYMPQLKLWQKENLRSILVHTPMLG